MRTGILHYTYSGEEYYAIILNIPEEENIDQIAYFKELTNECIEIAAKMEPKIRENEQPNCHIENIWLEVDGVEMFRINSFKKR